MVTRRCANFKEVTLRITPLETFCLIFRVVHLLSVFLILIGPVRTLEADLICLNLP